MWTPNSNVSLHRYIRAPEIGRTALVHINAPTNSIYGAVRASFVDEASVPVDE